MYCPNCGKDVDERAEICVHCGVRVKEEQASNSVDNPSHLAGVASCCFPVVGLILYFLWKDDKPESAKLVCNWMIGGLVVWVVWYIFFFMFGFWI